MTHQDMLILTSEELLDQLSEQLSTAVSKANQREDRQSAHKLIIELAPDLGSASDDGHKACARIDVERNATMVLVHHSYDQLRCAAQLGWRRIWVNEQHRLAPGPMPIQDGDISTLEAVNHVVELIEKPALSQCLTWWDEWKLPENVRRHARVVAWGAYALGVLMRRAGVMLDPILAHRGGLLHDLDKIKTLKESGGHGQLGAAFLESQGYPRLAQVIRGHVLHTILEAESTARCWETQLVYFIDKLVEGDQFVPLDVRLAALKKRYPAYAATMARAEGDIWALNDQVCSILSISDHIKLITKLKKLQKYQ